MHVFRHSPEQQTISSLWQQCEQALTPGPSRIRSNRIRPLLAFARLECALADYWSPERDDLLAQPVPFLEASLRLAMEYLLPDPVTDQIDPGMAVRPLLARLHNLLPPAGTSVSLSAWEGFRYYALFPERYCEAADRWREEHPGRAAWVLGLRSMGSGLAPIVAARLRLSGVCVRWLTLRPRGEPHNRQCRIGPRLQRAFALWQGDFLIVDEGPGLSGSSFGGAATLLDSLGIESARLSLFPGWDPPASALTHAASAALWTRLRRYPAAALQPPRDAVMDLSAGGWRRHFPGRQGVPAWTQHERVKYLSAGGELVKFAGLGQQAESAMERADELAAASFTPPVSHHGAGWIRYRLLQAQPLRLAPSLLRSWSATAGAYLAFLASRFRMAGVQPPHPQLREMVSVNVQALLATERLPPAPDGVPVALDARMLPHEWGRVGERWIKFDAIDHCDDPFFPGPCDIAWDLASVEIEFGGEVGQAVTRAYRRHSGDQDVNVRLPWYRLAYCAFRTAWCRLAAEHADQPDASRFAALATRYEAQLRRLHAGDRKLHP